ncbi:MAG: anthranilate phosphoribosyltransferase [Phycisphaerales bacterium]|nr:anthranilate phosphoribosyltransferase [Phycisphaerales bacterium]
MEAPLPNLTPSEFARIDRPGDLTPFLKLLIRGHTLTVDQSRAAFTEIMTGSAHEAELGAFLALLARRLPTVDELVGAATVMRERATALPTTIDTARILDTAGTGGAPKSFNVSTLAAIVAASAGVPVAKHGNRSRTGRGSAEVLMQLGVDVDAHVEIQRRCLEEVGVAFCFAPRHHPAAKHVMPTRKALGFPTIFNLLGPLTNPARARRQAIGVYDRGFVPILAQVLRELGAIRALVYHSFDGLDEISTGAATLLAEVANDAPLDSRGGTMRVFEVTPEMLGVTRVNPLSVAADSVQDAADLFIAVLENRAPIAARDFTLANAGAALWAGGSADTLRGGVELARTTLACGKSRATLDGLIRVSQGRSV